MPQQFQNYAKHEVKEAIRQDIVNLKDHKRFSLDELYNLAERKEAELKNRIEHVPEDVDKVLKYRYARKSELKKLKKHHEDIFGFKAQRKSVDKFIKSLEKKRNKKGRLSLDVTEKKYMDSTFFCFV